MAPNDRSLGSARHALSASDTCELSAKLAKLAKVRHCVGSLGAAHFLV